MTFVLNQTERIWWPITLTSNYHVQGVFAEQCLCEISKSLLGWWAQALSEVPPDCWASWSCPGTEGNIPTKSWLAVPELWCHLRQPQVISATLPLAVEIWFGQGKMPPNYDPSLQKNGNQHSTYNIDHQSSDLPVNCLPPHFDRQGYQLQCMVFGPMFRNSLLSMNCTSNRRDTPSHSHDLPVEPFQWLTWDMVTLVEKNWILDDICQ